MHEDHVAGALKYFKWCKQNNHPIRLMMEPGIYELFKEQANLILDQRLEEIYNIDFIPLKFYEKTILSFDNKKVFIESSPAWHGTPTTSVRITYKGETISCSSDTTYDFVRIEEIVRNQIPEHIRKDLIKDGFPGNENIFDEKRADEILNFLLKPNSEGNKPAIIIFDGGTKVPKNKNTTNHTTPFTLVELPVGIQKTIFVNHTNALPDNDRFYFSQAIPMATLDVNNLPNKNENHLDSIQYIIRRAA